MENKTSTAGQLAEISQQLLEIRQLLELLLPPHGKRRAVISAAVIAEGKDLFAAGLSTQEVARRLGISKTSAFNVHHDMLTRARRKGGK